MQLRVIRPDTTQRPQLLNGRKHGWRGQSILRPDFQPCKQTRPLKHKYAAQVALGSPVLVIRQKTYPRSGRRDYATDSEVNTGAPAVAPGHDASLGELRQESDCRFGAMIQWPSDQQGLFKSQRPIFGDRRSLLQDTPPGATTDYVNKRCFASRGTRLVRQLTDQRAMRTGCLPHLHVQRSQCGLRRRLQELVRPFAGLSGR